MIRVPVPDLAPGSERRVLVPFVLAVPFLLLVPPIGILLLAVGGFSVYFYRDPDREPSGEGVLSPADGHVSVVREDGDNVRVGVFMSPFDVHVCRAPADGTVTRLDHRGAAHKPAFAKDSERNERFEYTLDAGENATDRAGVEAGVVDADGDADRVDGALIAGWFARRITPYVSHGDPVTRGERIGYIAFGSRADVVLPSAYSLEDVRVSRGEAVRAGESVIARRE
ncbi:protein sorting system archaetidylserine decarboxylase [Halobaculum magnesiiphilum]|uniref:Protein sorting system archaetidylserine decarboxylase n=1 Tax=Halobaculum magnesiiphilum TaxID=1017351 RepID=A0A8T8W995_9EURY|nr:protein sorting system archaetidylserine decarboxylase [Halobaculum magnesiiphilum]QZP36386.1 protein sorting system archaetidylserine decarboxylase [Halobaculum magnesiiphilum]